MPKTNDIAKQSGQALASVTVDKISQRILTMRGVQVMLDRDLAELYGVETRALIQAVKRNIERFPEDFMFQLTQEEFAHLKFQIGISSSQIADNQQNLKSQFVTSNWGGTRKLPYVFTEQGVAQLSGILRSAVAVKMNIQVIRAFVAMRRFMVANAQIFQRLDRVESLQLQADERQTKMEHRFEELLDKLDDGSVKPIEGVFVEGQVLDARIYVEELIASAQREIVLIDNYIDARTFDILEKRRIGVKATVYTESVGRNLLAIQTAHEIEYPTRKIELKTYNNRFHDRFIIIDDALYHFGASFNELGKKLFAFTKMNIDKDIILKQL